MEIILKELIPEEPKYCPLEKHCYGLNSMRKRKEDLEKPRVYGTLPPKSTYDLMTSLYCHTKTFKDCPFYSNEEIPKEIEEQVKEKISALK